MCSLSAFQNSQLESTIDRRKCGDVLISLDVKFLTLHCIFCEIENDDLDTFLDHLRNVHWNLLVANGPYEEKIQVKEEVLEVEETTPFDIKPDVQEEKETDPLMPKGKIPKKMIILGHDSSDSDEADDDYDIKINNAITNSSNESLNAKTDDRIRDVDVSKLIEHIQEHPILWNSQIPYKRSKHKEAIETIAKKMLEESPTVKIDYQYIRKKLNKLKRMYYNYNKSGQKHTQKEIMCFQKLHFLKGHEPIKGLDRKKEQECPLCCIVFKNLPEHMNRCHEEGDRRQACEICEEVLPSQRKLKMHLRSVHRRFECEYCDTVYASLKSIKKHMRRDHTDKPQLPMHGLEKESLENVCEYCGKKFNFRQCLSNHIKNVHLQLRPYACTECSKAYKAKDKLKSHMNSVHLNIRPFVCDVCSRAFYDRKTMVQHKRIHSDVKNYSCKLCASAFRQASSLNSHMKTHQTMFDS